MEKQKAKHRRARCTISGQVRGYIRTGKPKANREHCSVRLRSKPSKHCLSLLSSSSQQDSAVTSIALHSNDRGAPLELYSDQSAGGLLRVDRAHLRVLGRKPHAFGLRGCGWRRQGHALIPTNDAWDVSENDRGRRRPCKGHAEPRHSAVSPSRLTPTRTSLPHPIRAGTGSARRTCPNDLAQSL